MSENQINKKAIQEIVLEVIAAINAGKLKQSNFYFMSIEEVLKETGCRSAQTLYSWVRQGVFPQPYRLVEGGRTVGWRSDSIQEWKKSREMLKHQGELLFDDAYKYLKLLKIQKDLQKIKRKKNAKNSAFCLKLVN